jgi:high-affinity Fe2+/Pb2+ permease
MMMKASWKLNQLIVGMAAIGALSLTGCGAKQDAEVAISPVPVPKVPEKVAMEKTAAGGAAAAAGGAAMMNVVKEAKTAITAGDFSKAGAALDKFEGSWKMVSSGVKAKSPKAHDAIEAGLDKLKTAVKAKDALQAKSALTAIETSLSVVK